MPIYEYRCEKDHLFEVIQSMSADPVTACEECGAPVERVFHPIAVHFKGSGFYNTDYKNNSKTGKDSKETSGDKSTGDKKSDSGSSDSGSSDSGSSDSGSSDSGSKSDSGKKSDSKSSSSDKPKAKSSSD